MPLLVLYNYSYRLLLLLCYDHCCIAATSATTTKYYITTTNYLPLLLRPPQAETKPTPPYHRGRGHSMTCLFPMFLVSIHQLKTKPPHTTPQGEGGPWPWGGKGRGPEEHNILMAPRKQFTSKLGRAWTCPMTWAWQIAGTKMLQVYHAFVPAFAHLQAISKALEGTWEMKEHGSLTKTCFH